MQTAHELDVDGSQSMARGLDEVEAGVNAVVDELGSVDSVFLFQICVESSLDVVNNRLPAGKARE